MSLDLLLQVGDLLLGEADRICAGEEAGRRLLLVGDRHERAAELRRVTALLSVLRVPPFELLRPAVGVVVDRRLGVARRLVREKLGPEEPRIDDRGVDAERRDLGRKRLDPALETELRRSVSRAELEPEIVTTFPDRCLRMTGRTARVTFIGPTRFVVSCPSICSGVSSSK